MYTHTEARTNFFKLFCKTIQNVLNLQKNKSKNKFRVPDCKIRVQSYMKKITKIKII